MKKFFESKRNILIVSIVATLIIVGAVVFSMSKENVNIRESEAQKIQLVEYTNENFKMKIPSGWKVETCGENMYFSIKVYNPNDERYQIFAILKAEPFLKNDKAKTWYENYYNSFGGIGNKQLAKALVLYNGSVEEFYNNFNAYVKYVKEIDTSNTFNAPDLQNFVVVETYENNSQLKNIAKDDKIVRGTFQNSKTGENGEGLFMATIVDQGVSKPMGYDMLFYTAYNVMGISTAEYDLVNYENILTQSLNSLEYTDSFVNATIKNSNEATKNALQMNASIQQAFDSYNSAWSNRQSTYDISSQKYSDATLGYERVYDTQTGEVYKAYNGFTDEYDGKRYQAITDDMYLESIAGYIEK